MWPPSLLTLHTFWHLRHGRVTRFKSRPELETWQDQQVQTLLRRILPHAPYYRQQLGPRPLSQWREMPLTNKQSMMANFDTLNTAGLTSTAVLDVAQRAEESRDFSPTLHGYTVGLSSGTSGQRGLFLLSEAERARWAGAVLAKLLRDPLWRRQKIAFFLRANSNLYQSVRSRHIQFHFYDLLDPLPAHIARLNDLQPTVLVGPPSLLRYLAAQVGQALHISPRQIISVAELLNPLDQRFIEERFQRRLDQVYQATEGFLACTCAHGTLHLNEDMIVVQKEWLSPEAERRFVPIITDFHRTTQPIIRYRLDDVLVLADAPCPCGSLYAPLAHIEGRCDDLLYLRPAEVATADNIVLFPDFVRRLLASLTAVSGYEVRQDSPGQLDIALAVPPHLRPTAEAEITAGLGRLARRLRAYPPQIRFSDLPLALERPTAVKRRRIRRTN